LYRALLPLASFLRENTVTVADTTTGSAGPADRRAVVRQLTEQFPRFGRVLHGLKTQLNAENRDQAAQILLFPLCRLGPVRQGTLAELVHADPSTVSRHVATLVDQGLVRRVADETDGRASKLVVTDDGRASLDALRAEREAHLERALALWSDDDVAALTTLLSRLIDDLSASLPGDIR
jgi:DNA-binding MarR family transcriptional regulator